MNKHFTANCVIFTNFTGRLSALFLTEQICVWCLEKDQAFVFTLVEFILTETKVSSYSFSSCKVYIYG